MTETDWRESTFEGTITAALRGGAGDGTRAGTPKARSRDVALTGPHGLLKALTQPMTETSATATWVTTLSGLERAGRLATWDTHTFGTSLALKLCPAPTG